MRSPMASLMTSPRRTAEEMLSWISRINLVAALFSSPPFPAAVGSQRRFVRPILPTAPSRSPPEEQLRCHEQWLERVAQELLEHQRHLPEGRGRARDLDEYRVKKEFLMEEVGGPPGPQGHLGHQESRDTVDTWDNGDIRDTWDRGNTWDVRDTMDIRDNGDIGDIRTLGTLGTQGIPGHQGQRRRYETYVQVLETWLSSGAQDLEGWEARAGGAPPEPPTLTKAHSSPSLAPEPPPGPAVRVRRNISERRTVRKIVPKRNKNLL
ncbi:hypothetical protein WISP_00881 [Willisornis vidua]|uniref:Uncharacterized protein n=1 Tax=Willisornis vidua TaxID=1566151 RepID=A0ABQ9DVP1_9PASS|nr:hypothetical protein WISP_00881 [Willisornis vidua]